jgi:hypothetical protein
LLLCLPCPPASEPRALAGGESQLVLVSNVPKRTRQNPPITLPSPNHFLGHQHTAARAEMQFAVWCGHCSEDHSDHADGLPRSVQARIVFPDSPATIVTGKVGNLFLDPCTKPTDPACFMCRTSVVTSCATSRAAISVIRVMVISARLPVVLRESTFSHWYDSQ